MSLELWENIKVENISTVTLLVKDCYHGSYCALSSLHGSSYISRNILFCSIKDGLLQDQNYITEISVYFFALPGT